MTQTRFDAARALAKELEADSEKTSDRIREIEAAYKRDRLEASRAARLAAAAKIRPLIVQEFGELGPDLDPLNGVESFATVEEALKAAGVATTDSLAHYDHRLVLDVSSSGFEVRAGWFCVSSTNSWLEAVRDLRDRLNFRSQNPLHEKIFKACTRFLVGNDPLFVPEKSDVE